MIRSPERWSKLLCLLPFPIAWYLAHHRNTCITRLAAGKLIEPCSFDYRPPQIISKLQDDVVSYGQDGGRAGIGQTRCSAFLNILTQPAVIFQPSEQWTVGTPALQYVYYSFFLTSPSSRGIGQGVEGESRLWQPNPLRLIMQLQSTLTYSF